MEIPVSHHSQLVFCRRSRVCRNFFKHVRGGGTASKRSIVVSVVIVVLFFAALVFIVLLVFFFMLTLVLIVVVIFLLVAFPRLYTFLASTSLLFVGFRHPNTLPRRLRPLDPVNARGASSYESSTPKTVECVGEEKVCLKQNIHVRRWLRKHATQLPFACYAFFYHLSYTVATRLVFE